MDWNSILAPTLPLLEVVVRGTIIFLALLILMRVVGQRESGGLGITDVLLVVLVAQAAAPGLNGEGESIGDGLILIVTMLAWSVIVDALAYRFPFVARLLKAKPKLLIKNGRLNRKVMLREFMTRAEVESQLRLHGIEEVGQVERVYVEPNGMISIVRRDGGESEPTDPPF
ncbi:DUF421 domain-containing protein [Glutamicibacter creatinolyticus]|uniref:DUF421 domain-containing protein n=1 Tax=Glutamicibacter creatinolyticus TaxID=162496 RepID=UPI003216EA5C